MGKASGLTEHTAALAAAAGMAVQKCPQLLNMSTAAPAMGALAAPVMCTVDLKNTAKHLFHSVKLLTKTHDQCENSHHDCTVDSLDVAGSLAGFGSWLSGAIGHCSRTTALAGVNASKADTRGVLCAQAATALVEQTLKVAQDGVELSKLCKSDEPEAPKAKAVTPTQTVVGYVQTPRLYEQEGVLGGSSTLNFVLGALLPVTAIASFVGGRFYAR